MSISVPRSGHPAARIVALSATAAVMAAALVGCAPTRSVAAYCAAVQEHKTRYLSAMNAAAHSSMFGDLIGSAAAIGDLQTMWSDLAKVAPPAIETDTETVRDSWSKVQDDASSKNMIGALAAAVSSAPAMGRVNTYIAKHCGAAAAPVGTGTGSAAPSAEATSTPSAAAETTSQLIPQATGTAVANGPESVLVESGDDDTANGALNLQLSTVSGASVMSATAVVDLPAGLDRTGEAFGAQQDASQVPSFVVAQTLHTPSSGLTPESWRTTLTAVAADGAVSGSPVSLAGCTTEDCTVSGVQRVGGLALVAWQRNGDDPGRVTAVDLQTGSTAWTRSGETIQGVDGTVVLLGAATGNDLDPTEVDAVAAATGSTLWTVREAAWNGDQVTYEQTFGGHLGLLQLQTHADDDLHRLEIIDTRTGAVRFTRFGDGHENIAFDPSDQQFVISGTSGALRDAESNRFDLVVMKSDGTQTFGISTTRFDALGDPQVRGALDGRAWIDGQNGTEVIDTATGADVPVPSPSASNSGGTRYIPIAYDGDRTDFGSAVLLDARGTPSFEDVQNLGQ